MSKKLDPNLMPFGRFEGVPFEELDSTYLMELPEVSRLNKSKLTSKEKLVRDYIDNNIKQIMDSVEFADSYYDEDNSEFFEEQH